MNEIELEYDETDIYLVEEEVQAVQYEGQVVLDETKRQWFTHDEKFAFVVLYVVVCFLTMIWSNL